MFQLLGRALIALATAATVGVGVSPAQAAPTASAPANAVVRRAVAEPRLVDVDFVQRRDSDRLVLRFRGGVPDDVQARLVRVVRDRDGDRVRLPGRVFVVLRLEPARARDFERGVIDADLDNVRAVRLVEDRRGVVLLALGLRQRPDDVEVSARGNRLIVDVDRDR